MIRIEKAAATGSKSFEDYCYDRLTQSNGEMMLMDQQLSKDQQEMLVTVHGNDIQQDKIDIQTNERKSPVQEIIPAFLKISPILQNSSDFSLSDCLSSASTHFSVSSVPTTRPASDSCDILSESLQVLLSTSDINARQDITGGKLLEDFETNLMSSKQEDEKAEDQQMYLKDSILELGSRFARKCSSIDQGGQDDRKYSPQILRKSDGNQGEKNNANDDLDCKGGKEPEIKEEISFIGRIVFLKPLAEQNQNEQPAKDSFDPFKHILDDSEGSPASPSNLQLDMEVLEQIQQIDKQEDEDEAASPTLRLHRVVQSSNNSIEERIFQWLDKEGVKQVDPSQKREEYYNQKRDNLIEMRSHQTLPSLQQIGSSNSNLSELKMGTLRLCKITSSPLFNRRKQGKDESNASKLEKENNSGKSYSQPIQEEDDQTGSNIHGDSKNKIYEEDEDILFQKSSKKPQILLNTSQFGRRAVLEGDSQEDSQGQILERIIEIQLEDTKHVKQGYVPKLEINKNLKRRSLKLAQNSPSISPGKDTLCNSVSQCCNNGGSININWTHSSFILNIKNTCKKQNETAVEII